jgi:tetratricopeptide (TPR) repeat protein
LEGIIASIEQLELMVSHNEHKKTEVLILKAKIQSALNNETESTKTWKLALDTDRDYLAALEYCVFMASKAASFPQEYFDKSMNSEYIHESFKLDKAAELFYHKKEYTKAKQYIENSIAKGYCESTDALLLASKIYSALGNIKLADEFGNKARTLLDNENKQQPQQNDLIK